MYLEIIFYVFFILKEYSKNIKNRFVFPIIYPELNAFFAKINKEIEIKKERNFLR